jgi:hypothetical protein
MSERMLLPIEANNSNSTSTKFSNIVHAVLTLHHMIITCFSTSKNVPESEEQPRNKRRYTALAERLDSNFF